MSGTLSGDDDDFGTRITNLLSNPAFGALAGMTQGFAQAAMPTRMPTPFGAVLGMGAGGLLQGASNAQKIGLEGQQLQSAKMRNQQQQMVLDWYKQRYGQNGSPFGAPVASGGSSLPGGANGAGGAQSGYLRSPSDIMSMGDLAMATNNDRTASALYNLIQQQAGGTGYAMGANNTAFAVPGGSADPRVVAQKEAATQWAGVAPAIAKTAGQQAATAPYAPPITIPQMGPDGLYHDFSYSIPQWAAQNGGGAGGAGTMPLSMYVQRVTTAENPTGNPAASNPNSTATGNGQFINSTWVPLFRQTFPQSQGMSDQQVLALRSNSQVSAQMTAALARQNATTLSGAGVPTTAANLGMAHQLGAQGALGVIQSDPNTPLPRILPPNVIQANPALANQTAGSFRANAAFRYGTTPVDFGSNGPIMGKPIMTPEQEAESKAYGEQSTDIIKAAASAPMALQRLDVLQNASQYFRPGSTGEMRLAGTKLMVDALQGLGITPPDWVLKGAAAGETISKEGGFLAAQMTRALGSREAAAVFNQIRSIQPNIEMSTGGFSVVTNSIKQGLLRDQDLAQFREAWLADGSHGGSIRGMNAAFEKQYPVEAYASRVLPYPVPKSATQLIPNVIYTGPRGLGLWDGQKFQPVGGGS